MADADLLHCCRIDTFRGTGRGGQKRNTTESAVRATHLASGIAATSDATRSQIRNRASALAALRRRLALEWRCLPPEAISGAVPVGRRGGAYLVWLAGVLDVLATREWAVGEAAVALGISTSRLVKLLADEPAFWQYVNRQRERQGLTSLRRP